MADLDRRKFLRALGIGSAAAAAAPLMKQAAAAVVEDKGEIRPAQGEALPRVAQSAPAQRPGPEAIPASRSGATFSARRKYVPGVDPILDGKGYVIATDSKVENIEGYGASCGDSNGSLIRVQADECDLANIYAHDNESGVLSDLNKKRVTLRRSRFARNGSNGSSQLAHNLYLQADTVEFFDSVSLYAKDSSHMLKSRGMTTTVQRAILAGLDGWNSRCADLCAPGDAFFDQVILQVGPNNDGGWNLIYHNSEGATVGGKLHLGRVIAVNDWGKPNTALLYFKGANLIIDDLIWIGPSDPQFIYNKGTGTIGSVHKTVYPTRAAARAAGLNCPDYDGTERCVRALWPQAWGPQPGLWDEDKIIPRGQPITILSVPASVPSGGSASVSWQASNADYVEGLGAIGGPLPLNGQTRIGPLTGPAHIGVRAFSFDMAVDTVKDIAIGSAKAIDLSKLPTGWTELPGTIFPGKPDELIDWCSAALTDVGLITLAGGGHKQSAGVTGDVWLLPLASLKWQMERRGGKIIGTSSAIPGQAYAVVDDGPSPRHHYDAVEWLPNIKRVFVGGLFPDFADPARLPVIADTKSTGAFLYDPATKSYKSVADVLPGAYSCAEYDTKRGLLYLQDYNANSLVIFDPAKRAVVKTERLLGYEYWDTWTALTLADDKLFLFNGDPAYQIYVCLVIDVSDLGKIKQTGFNLNPGVAPGSWGRTYQPAANPPVAEARITKAHGLAYRPRDGLMYACNGGPNVVRIDPKTLTFSVMATQGGPKQPTSAADGANGMFGKWRYLPQHDAFLSLCSPSQNVWVLKP
jgi:hypothetical protein